MKELWEAPAYRENRERLDHQISKLLKVISRNHVRTVSGYGFKLEGVLTPVQRRIRIAILPGATPTIGVKIPARQQTELWGVGFSISQKLANVVQLSVVPMTALAQFAGGWSVDAVSTATSANVILTCLISGPDFLRRGYSFELIDVAANRVLWSEQFARSAVIFDVQNIVANAVLQTLQISPPAPQIEKVQNSSTTDRRAYDLYIEGRFFWLKSTADNVIASRALFEKAIERDPQYALAHAALADAWILLGVFAHQVEPSRVVLRKAGAAARKALEIDPNLNQAHAALAAVRALFDWNWPAAETGFRKANEPTSTDPTTRTWYSLCLAAQGRFDEACLQINTAIQDEPQSCLLHALKARGLYLARKYHEAHDAAQQAVRLEPYFFLGHVFLSHSLREMGKMSEAFQALEKALPFSGYHPTIVADIGYLCGRMGRISDAENAIAQLRFAAKSKLVSPYLNALVLMGLGRTDEALLYLEKCLKERSAWLIFLAVDPLYDSMQRLRRFRTLKKKVGLT